MGQACDSDNSERGASPEMVRGRISPLDIINPLEGYVHITSFGKVVVQVQSLYDIYSMSFPTSFTWYREMKISG